MGKTRRKPAADRDPAEVPLYTAWDVARYLGLPVWTVPAMTGHGPPDPGWFVHALHRRWPHDLPDDEFPFPTDDFPRLSFRWLADVFVRGFALQAAREATRADRSKPDRRGRVFERAWQALELQTGGPGVFGEGAVDRLVERCAAHLPGTDPDRLRKLLLQRLERVEVGEGGPQRLFPFSRDPAEGSPRAVVLDPRVRFGRPTLAGRGVPTDAIIERFRAGDSAAELAEDFGIPPAEAEEAIRYESLYPNSFPFFPFGGW